MPKDTIESLDPKKHIIIKGARVHNLKNVDVALPRNQMVVITGLSGSGKSSLAFDTLYAEGQRRYVESLSAYARQFLGKLDKPDVDFIKGISPAVAIEQKVTSTNSRSTVGTSTEIYDYLKLLFARVGRTFSPISGQEVKRHKPADVLDEILTAQPKQRYMVACEMTVRTGRTKKEQIEVFIQQGYSRAWIDGEAEKIDASLEKKWKKGKTAYLIIDRLATGGESDEDQARIVDSVELAFFEGAGQCEIIWMKEGEVAIDSYNNRFMLDDMEFTEPSPNFFSFNNPVGACKTCEGFGSVIGIDPDLVVPDKSKSIYDDAVACWRGEKMSQYKGQLLRSASKFDFPIHKPFHELSQKHVALLWKGNAYFEGLDAFFQHLEEQSYKIQYRVMLSRYRGKTKCPDCKGTRLRKDARYVKIADTPITDLMVKTVDECLLFFKQALGLSPAEKKIADRLLYEINSRLTYLQEVGLGYLTLDRNSNSLSGGESQRINLATILGSSLVGSMYVLDEPSIGLHPRDTQRLIRVLRALQKLGNTVIVVEHDEDIMQEADYIIDMGPEAGTQGGEVVFAGPASEISKSHGLTAKYLTGEMVILPPKKRKWKDRISIQGARQNNLKNISVDIPLHVLTAITGVSGSGKSTLVSDILYPALARKLGGHAGSVGEHDGLEGDFKMLEGVEYIDQNPIGKSSRSNPVTYVKAYDEIRAIMSGQALSKNRGFKPSTFSFNVSGGRCDTCEGEGQVTIEMQFMADIKLQCETCRGKRFKDEVLEVEYEGHSIADILNLTVDDAVALFLQNEKKPNHKKLLEKLKPLQAVGLGYVKLGQASSTLSGGEAQRIKLASFLIGNRGGKKLFIFDEPSTGLHFHDVKKLLDAFHALIGKGHSVLVIEHNMDIVAHADWVIDIGPEGGKGGGNIIFEGTPEDLATSKKGYTSSALANKLEMIVNA